MSMQQRPAELDELSAFLGRWEGATETIVRGTTEVRRGVFRGSWTWDCDKYCVVDRNEHDFGAAGRTQGMSVWSWDALNQCYRFYWINSSGATGEGIATYDVHARAWHTEGKARSSVGIRNTKGSIRMLDDQRAEWVWQEFSRPFSLRKMLEMRGRSKKQ